MELWLYRVGLGVLLLILEMFVMSFDALALSIAAFVTAGLSYALGIDIFQRQQSLVIFLIASVIALLIVRMILVPKIEGESVQNPMSGDSIIGKQFTVQKVNKRDVIKYEGMYRNMKSDDVYATGDTVEVLSMEDNVVRVKKV